jgi:hypothetical protein
MKETETLHKKECFSSEYDMLIDLLNQVLIFMFQRKITLTSNTLLMFGMALRIWERS